MSIKEHLQCTSSAFYLQEPFVCISTLKVIIMDKHLRKPFRKCVPMCPRFLTLEDTHNLCYMCMVEKHVHSVLEGSECAHCEKFTMSELHSRLTLLSRDEGQASVTRGN